MRNFNRAWMHIAARDQVSFDKTLINQSIGSITHLFGAGSADLFRSYRFWC